MSKQQFVNAIDGVLKPAGFQRRGNTWNRRTEAVVEVCDVQTSKAGDKLTVNLGILDAEVYFEVWDSPPKDFVQQPGCTVGLRIGDLIDGRDRWWNLADETGTEDVANLVRESVLPFLERTRDRAEMRRWLTAANVTKLGYPPPIISLAVLCRMLGDSAEACKVIFELRRKVIGAWRDKVIEISLRMGCE